MNAGMPEPPGRDSTEGAGCSTSPSVGWGDPVANAGPALLLVLQPQPDLPGIVPEDAADLLLTVVMLCDASVVLPQLDGLIAGSDPGRSERRRAAVVRTVHVAAEALLPASAGR
jgi:hypothetical protein